MWRPPLVATLAAVLLLSPALPARAVRAKTISVKLTDAGCPKQLKTVAGPTTFKVENVDADAVTEFEVLSGDRVLGEKENLSPGLSGEFTLTLKAGTYETYCPGGDRERGKLVVSGTSSTTLSPQAQTAVDQYRAYVQDQTAQ